jgi:hypothetical protein
MTPRTILTGTLLVSTVANVALWTGSRFLRARARLANGFEVCFRPGAAAPDGYLADGSAYGGTGSSDCALVRYVAAGCVYCLKDKPHWEALAARAAQSDCRIAGVVPDAASVLPRSSYGTGAETQFVFVSMEWVAESPPRRAPTTMILGKGGNLVWQHVGVLSDEDVRSALALLPPARKRNAN